MWLDFLSEVILVEQKSSLFFHRDVTVELPGIVSGMHSIAVWNNEAGG